MGHTLEGTVHEYLRMPPAASIAYIAYVAACAVYTAFVVTASIVSPAYRERVHRGSWLHIAEGWVLVAALWAGYGWAHHAFAVGDRSWEAASPVPAGLRNASVALWILLPPAILAPIAMAATTLVHAWRPRAPHRPLPPRPSS